MRILVVDNDGLVRKSAVDFFKDEGHEVFEASGGHDAIDQVQRHQPQFVLMDVQMPSLDAAQATRILRARGITVPIFAWTAAPEALNDSGHLFNAVFLKPIGLQTIYEAVLLCLGQHRAAPSETV